jgi:predicted nucleic-acid-binding Zn-ribbon protein
MILSVEMTSEDIICPKCASNMVDHPSLVSMPLSSSQEIGTSDNTITKANIEDQDANFIYRFRSCSKCGYTEFYLGEKEFKNIK